MSNKTDLQRNNVILGDTPNGLIGGVSRIESALEKKNVPVEKAGTYATFSELETAINDKVTDTYDADATATDIIKDKTAYVKGKKIIGEYNPPDLTDATATANDIANGKTAYIGSGKVTGTLVDRLQLKCDKTLSLKYEFENYPDTSLDNILTGLNTSKVIDLTNFCYDAKNLTSISLNIPSVQKMSSAFGGCSSLNTVELLNANNIENASSLFSNCKLLKNISGLDLSKVKSGYKIFSNCFSLESLPSLDISEMTSATWMFENCQKLTNLTLLNSSKLTNVGSMFAGCAALTTVSIDTNSVSNFSYMFNSCSSLTTISLNLINCGSANSITGIFASCYSLTNLTLKNIKYSIQLGSGTRWGHLLTNDSLINTIQELWDLTGQTAETLTMSTTSKENIANIYVKLITPTQEQIEADPYINNKKPCVVCTSTDEGAMLITDYAGLKNWTIA